MDSRLTVEQVLQTAGLINGKVLAGKSGLKRELTRITVSETPDSLDWIEGGELVCTTGYALINDKKLQADWIQGMADKNVAALILKTERFLGSVPAFMLELADQYNLPLIEIPLETTWPAVIEGVMNLMLSVQTNRMKASYSIYNQLTQLVLSSKGLNFIIDAISRMIKNPVFLEDRFLNPISYSCKREPIHLGYAKQRLQQNKREEIKNFMRTMKNNNMNAIHTLPLETPDGSVDQLITPVFAGKHLFGFLTVLIADDTSLDKEMLITIMNHGATVLALELLIDNTRFQLNTKEKAGLLKQLTDDTMPPLSELKKKGGLFGIDFELDTSVIIINCRPELTYYSFDRFEKYLLSIDPNAVIFLEKKNIVVFYHPKKNSTQYKAMEESKTVAEKLIKQLEKEQYTCFAGIGNSYSQPEPIRKSYFEAKQCMRKAASAKKRVLYQDYRSFESIVSMVHNHEDLLTLANFLLRNLTEYDKENNTELVKTLRRYFDCKCNQAQTSKALNIHVNTLTYRLARIQDILEVDLGDMETCSMLFFSLQLLEN